MWSGDALQWFGIFVSLFMIYYGYRYQFSKAPLEKQLYSAYLPMFRLLEPYLYKSSQSIGINKIREISDALLQIVENHYELIDPSIVHWSRLLKRSADKRDFEYLEIDRLFKYLCKLVDREFEKTRRRLFLPTRDIYYRLNNDQYYSKGRMYFDFLLTLIPQLLVLGGLSYLLFVLIELTDK